MAAAQEVDASWALEDGGAAVERDLVEADLDVWLYEEAGGCHFRFCGARGLAEVVE